MIALLHLKHALNESEKAVIQRWGETPAGQFFSGQAYFENHHPCDAATPIKLRRLLGEEGEEEQPKQTINVAVELKLMKPQELSRVMVDNPGRFKAIAHYTDSRRLENVRTKLVEAAKEVGINLKQTFAKEGKDLSRNAGRYVHSRQFNRLRGSIVRQRAIFGTLKREVGRKAKCHRLSCAPSAR